MKQKLVEQANSTVTPANHIYSEIMAPATNGTTPASSVHDFDSTDSRRQIDPPELSAVERQLKLLWPTPQKITVHPG